MQLQETQAERGETEYFISFLWLIRMNHSVRLELNWACLLAEPQVCNMSNASECHGLSFLCWSWHRPANHGVNQQVTSATGVATEAVQMGFGCEKFFGARRDKGVNLLLKAWAVMELQPWPPAEVNYSSVVQSCAKKSVMKLKATFSAGNDNCHILLIISL